MHVTIWMNPQNINVKKPDDKDYIFYVSIYMKYPEKKNLQKQNTDQQLTGAKSENKD